nr:hypothetical protein [Tanacetum cinerariifolium]
TPSPEATPLHYTTSSILLPSFPTAPIPIPTVTQTDPTPIVQYSRRARIAQSSALPTVPDEPASLGEGSGTPTEPHHTPFPESSALPTVADEPASPVRDNSQGEACPTNSGSIADQDRATISKSSTLPHDSAPRVTSPAGDEGKDREAVATKQSGEDAPIKGRSPNEGEAAAERI